MTSRAWTFGGNHSAEQWSRRMQKRGWTEDQVTEAILAGTRHPAVNNVTPANGATRFVHPTTGRSIVMDDVTNEVIHVGGDGYVY